MRLMSSLQPKEKGCQDEKSELRSKVAQDLKAEYQSFIDRKMFFSPLLLWA